jgi:hypothetical protein
MANDSILNEAILSASALIAAMRKVDGYNFDWGESNLEDMALATFPYAIIKIIVEECLDEENGAHACAFHNLVRLEIFIRQCADKENSNPIYDVRVLFLQALDDLKKLFGTNGTLDGYVDCMLYVGAEFDLTKIGNDDIFVPYEMKTNWKTRYTQSRFSPSEHA